MHCTYLQLTLIKWNPLQSSVLLVQVFQTHNIHSHFVDIVEILWLVRQFLGSSIKTVTTNLFLDLIFLLMIWLIFSKFKSPRFVVYAIVETFIIATHPAVAKKRSVISFSLLFSLSSFSFLVLALAKYCSNVLTKSNRQLVSCRRIYCCDVQG